MNRGSKNRRGSLQLARKRASGMANICDGEGVGSGGCDSEMADRCRSGHASCVGGEQHVQPNMQAFRPAAASLAGRHPCWSWPQDRAQLGLRLEVEGGKEGQRSGPRAVHCNSRASGRASGTEIRSRRRGCVKRQSNEGCRKHARVQEESSKSSSCRLCRGKAGMDSV